MAGRAWIRRDVLGPASLVLGIGCSFEGGHNDDPPADRTSSTSQSNAPRATSAAPSHTALGETGIPSIQPRDSSVGEASAGETSASASNGVLSDASVTSGSNANADANTSASTSSDTEPSTSTTQPPGLMEGLVATIEGQTVDFRTDMLTYNGRPPTMDVSAGSEDPIWLRLRVFVAPVGDGPIVPGEYPCDVGQSWVTLSSGSATYVSYEVPGTCTVNVIDPGVWPGEIFSGTFSGTVVKSDGSSPLTITNGSFYGIVD